MVLTKVQPHKGPLILTGKAAAILPMQPLPATIPEMQAEIDRTRAEIRRLTMLPARLLNGR
jgi:hypothetical protein